MDGEAAAADLRRRLTQDAAALAAQGVRARLATVLVGADPASRTYIARKHGDCTEIGIAAHDIRLPADITQAALLAQIAALNADPCVHGVLVQLPLPAHIDVSAVHAAIAPAKDVDGLTPANQSALLAGRPALRPCTPQAILHLLSVYAIPTRGQTVAIVGRGALVGRPLALMLAAPGQDAVPVVLHRAAGDLARHTRSADIIVSAAGVLDLVTAAMVKPGATVIGVGISVRDGQVRSDIADDVADVAAYVTPLPGAIGPLTRAMLMANVLTAARAQAPPQASSP